MTTKEIEIYKWIEKFIRGELLEDETDDLWIEFLKSPKLFDYFITYLHLMSVIKNQ